MHAILQFEQNQTKPETEQWAELTPKMPIREFKRLSTAPTITENSGLKSAMKKQTPIKRKTSKQVSEVDSTKPSKSGKDGRVKSGDQPTTNQVEEKMQKTKSNGIKFEEDATAVDAHQGGNQELTVEVVHANQISATKVEPSSLCVFHQTVNTGTGATED